MIAIQKNSPSGISELVHEVQAAWSPAQRRQRSAKGERRSQDFARLIGLAGAESGRLPNGAGSVIMTQRETG